MHKLVLRVNERQWQQRTASIVTNEPPAVKASDAAHPPHLRSALNPSVSAPGQREDLERLSVDLSGLLQPGRNMLAVHAHTPFFYPPLDDSIVQYIHVGLYDVE